MCQCERENKRKVPRVKRSPCTEFTLLANRNAETIGGGDDGGAEVIEARHQLREIIRLSLRRFCGPS